MSKPAATLGSYHTCPSYDGLVPHVGGPVMQGSTNVFIGRKPLARQGDPLQCNSARIDKIATASRSVFINSKGAARMTDKTAHGGVITKGDNSVFIG